MNIQIHTHASTHDCETCGSSWSSIHTLTGDLGELSHGTPAYCYDYEDGDMKVIVNFILDALEKKGFEFNRITQQMVDDFDSTVDWESFNNGIESGFYNYGTDTEETNLPDDVIQSYKLSDEYERFMLTGWTSVLEACGVHLEMSFSEDDYDDDYYGD